MASVLDEGVGVRRLLVPVVAYAIVLALIGGAGFALWTGGRSGNSAPPPISKAAHIEPLQAAGVPNLPPSRPDPAATGATKMDAAAALLSPSSGATSNSGPAASAGPTNMELMELAQEPAVSPPQGGLSNSDLMASAAKQPESPRTICTVDVGPWPIDSTEQAKAIQILMRDLGFYGGTTYGTLGPATRAAIRKFQISADQAETGEPSEMLFESLKKKCVFRTP